MLELWESIVEQPRAHHTLKTVLMKLFGVKCVHVYMFYQALIFLALRLEFRAQGWGRAVTRYGKFDERVMTRI